MEPLRVVYFTSTSIRCVSQVTVFTILRPSEFALTVFVLVYRDVERVQTGRLMMGLLHPVMNNLPICFYFQHSESMQLLFSALSIL
jgi:hypothetical protein